MDWQSGLRSSPGSPPSAGRGRPHWQSRVPASPPARGGAKRGGASASARPASGRRKSAGALAAYAAPRRRRPVSAPKPALRRSLRGDVAALAVDDDAAEFSGARAGGAPMSLDVARALLDEVWSRATAARARTRGRATRVNDTWSAYEHALPEAAVRDAVKVLDRRGVTERQRRWLLQLLLRVEADPLLDWRAKLRRLDRYLITPIPSAGASPAAAADDASRVPRRPRRFP